MYINICQMYIYIHIYIYITHEFFSIRFLQLRRSSPGLLRWVELDLGAARTVTEVRLYAPSDGFSDLMGSFYGFLMLFGGYNIYIYR